MSIGANIKESRSDMGPHVNEECLSIGEVIRLHHDSLLLWLKDRLAVPEDAYDIAQEAYIRMLKYEGSRDIRSPRAILQRIAMNVANDLGRSRRSRQADQHVSVDLFDDTDLPCDRPSVEQELLAREKYLQVCHVIESLPGKCRQVFLLSRVKGMTYPEIAEHCGISVKMVEKHISHALRICVEKTGGL